MICDIITIVLLTILCICAIISLKYSKDISVALVYLAKIRGLKQEVTSNPNFNPWKVEKVEKKPEVAKKKGAVSIKVSNT